MITDVIILNGLIKQLVIYCICLKPHQTYLPARAGFLKRIFFDFIKLLAGERRITMKTEVEK